MSKVDVAALIRNIPDFPEPGIQFKDITTVLKDGPAFRQVMQDFIDRYQGRQIDVVVGIESRGFIFSAPLAYTLGVGLVPIRKLGKLPAATYQVSYELEYGTNTMEIHRDALQPGMRVLVMDDLLATGGTIGAACELIEKSGGVIEELAFLIELSFLHGREKLAQYPIYSMIQY